MIGYPKTLNTKEDYEFVRQNFPKEEWKEDFEDLLATVNEWFNLGKLEEGDAGITDDTHKVVESEQDDGAVTERYQYEYKENPNARIYQLGYTVDEVKAILEG